TVTAYVPGGTPRSTYVPSLCDCVINGLPDAGGNVTVAPGMTACSGSATTPCTVAPVCWAVATIGVKAIKKSRAIFNVARNDILLLKKISIVAVRGPANELVPAAAATFRSP